MKTISFCVAVLLILLSLINFSTACTITSDDYALEVLLNKPGIAYNQNILVEAKNVKDTGDGHAYKSHSNPNLAVIISKIQPVTVRIQCPVQGSERKEPYFKIFPLNSFNNFELSENISGWERECDDENNPSKCVFEKEGIFVTVDKVSEEKYSLIIEIIGKNISSCSGNEYCSGKCIYYFGEGNCIPQDTTQDIENVLKETGTITNFAELTKQMRVEGGENDIYEMQPQYSCETINWKQAISQELTWLRVNSIISLNFEDIENISQISGMGRAGNSKIVYGENKDKEKSWIYYNESLYYAPNRIPNCREFLKTVMPTGMVAFDSGRNYYYTIPLIITSFVVVLFVATLIVAWINSRRTNKRKPKPVTTIYKAEE